MSTGSSVNPSPRIASAGFQDIQIKCRYLDRRSDAHRPERLLHDPADPLGVVEVGHQAVVDRHHPDPFQGTSAYHQVTPKRRRPSLTLPKSCFIPDQPRCDLTHLETKWLLLVQPVVEIAPAAHWAITTNQYASSLIIGFSPNRWNSLTMIVLTTSALSGVVMIES